VPFPAPGPTPDEDHKREQQRTLLYLQGQKLLQASLCELLIQLRVVRSAAKEKEQWREEKEMLSKIDEFDLNSTVIHSNDILSSRGTY
jgi:hypothetical protein